MNVLHLCSSQGFTRHVAEIIDIANKHFIVSDYLDSVTKIEENNKTQKKTSLFFAIEMGHGGFLEIIQLLVKNGSNVNFKDEFGKTPIFYASELGQDDTLEILLAAKAEVNGQDLEFKKTPMHVAIENGQYNSL